MIRAVIRAQEVSRRIVKERIFRGWLTLWTFLRDGDFV